MSRIIIDHAHPAHFILANQGVGFLNGPTAESLKIGIVNLMPNPIDPVRDFSILFARYSKHDVEIVDFTPTPELVTTKPDMRALRHQHLLPVSELTNSAVDGILITGFGGERDPFEEIDFWSEITELLDYAKSENIPVYASCWASQGALYHHHHVTKTFVEVDKISGVFEQTVISSGAPLMKGIDQSIPMPVSRNGRSDDQAIRNNPDLTIVAESQEAGISIATDGHLTCVTGHPEYDVNALPNEYERDIQKGLEHVKVPKNIFVGDDPNAPLLPNSWQNASGKFMSNWLDSVHYSRQKKQGGEGVNVVVPLISAQSPT